MRIGFCDDGVPAVAVNANLLRGPPGRRPSANDIVKPFRYLPANAGAARDLRAAG